MANINYITSRTPIPELVGRGIIPEWLANDAMKHGMSEAENILCEWDWDWNWDLGDGYSENQLKILAEVRKTIQQGIDDFELNPDLVAAEKRRREFEEVTWQQVNEYKERFVGYMRAGNAEWVIRYERNYGHLPYLHFICHYFLAKHHSGRRKAKFMYEGILGEGKDIEELKILFPELTKSFWRTLKSKKVTFRGKMEEYAKQINVQLPKELPDENDESWNNLINQNGLHIYDVSPAKLRKVIEFLRKNI